MEQQDIGVLLLLLGVGAVALLLMQNGNQGPGGAAMAPLSTNGHTPAGRAVPFYQNEESWELERDPDTGLVSKLTVHRDARVTK